MSSDALDELRDAFSDGRVMLFTGAGFSADARDADGESRPLGDAMAKELRALCFDDDCDDDSSLADLYDVAARHHRDELAAYLRRRLVVGDHALAVRPDDAAVAAAPLRRARGRAPQRHRRERSGHRHLLDILDEAQHRQLRRARRDEGDGRPRSFLVTPHLSRARRLLLEGLNIAWISATAGDFADGALRRIVAAPRRIGARDRAREVG